MITLLLLSLAADPRVVMETAAGEIELVLYADKAPVTVANFVRNLQAGLYTGGRFHRVVRMDNQPQSRVKIEVVQAGPAVGRRPFGPIALERTSVTGLRHLDGVISMARDGPDTATADFFICVGDQPELDFGGGRNADGQGFAAFGRVTRGIEVVRRIQASGHVGQRLRPPVSIRRMTIR